MEHQEYKVVNQSVRKKDSMQLLLGKPVYTDDVTPKNALVVKILRSPHANAMVESIQTDIAKKNSGCCRHLHLGRCASNPICHRRSDLSRAFPL